MRVSGQFNGERRLQQSCDLAGRWRRNRADARGARPPLSTETAIGRLLDARLVGVPVIGATYTYFNQDGRRLPSGAVV